MSKIINYSEARNNLKKYLDYVIDNNDSVIITRKNGEEVVMMSKKDYDIADETSYLLSSENNRNNLFESIEKINNNEWKNWKSYSIEDLKKDLEK